MKHECPATCPQRSSNCPTDRARKNAADSRFSFMTYVSPANLADSLIQRARSSRFGSTWLFQRRSSSATRRCLSPASTFVYFFFAESRDAFVSARLSPANGNRRRVLQSTRDTRAARGEERALARRDETPRAELITRQSESSKAPGLSVPIQSPGITLSSSRLPPRLPLKSLNPPRNGIAALRAACD